MYMDNIKCCNCEFEGLVQAGAVMCPDCKVEGSLAWKGDEP